MKTIKKKPLKGIIRLRKYDYFQRPYSNSPEIVKYNMTKYCKILNVDY
jgi:hypothetical protein